MEQNLIYMNTKKIYRLIDNTHTPHRRLLVDKVVSGKATAYAIIYFDDRNIYFDFIEVPSYEDIIKYLKEKYGGFKKVVVLTRLEGFKRPVDLYDFAGAHLYNYVYKKGINIKI